MKKIFLALLTMLALCVSITAFAAKPYIHPDYNLQNVREIHITAIDNEDGEPARKFYSDENAEIKVMSALFQGAGKLRMIATDDTKKPVSAYSGAARHLPTQIELRVTINHCGYSRVFVPGHYEEYTTHETRYYYDDKGHRHSYTVDIPRQRWIEESYYNHAYISLVYNFYDMEDGTLIATYSDSRDREYESDAAGGMLNRSVKDCFNKVFKK